MGMRHARNVAIVKIAYDVKLTTENFVCPFTCNPGVMRHAF